jgi:hypothetical protein
MSKLSLVAGILLSLVLIGGLGPSAHAGYEPPRPDNGQPADGNETEGAGSRYI